MQLAKEDLIASTIAAICAAKCNYLVIFIVGLLLGLLPSQSRAAEPYIQMYLSCDPPGRCPEYRIAVYEDKRVWFQGINSVEAVGERWASISLDALLALKQKVMKADFFQRLDEYPFMANLPHCMDIQIRVNDGTKTKTI